MSTLKMAKGFKPSKALGNESRLEDAAVVEIDGQHYIATTDSYRLVLVPVETDAPAGTRISGDVLRALEAERGDALLVIEDDGSQRIGNLRYDAPSVSGEFPAVEALIPDPPAEALTFGVSAKYLQEAAQALNCTLLKVTVSGPRRPILIEPVEGGEGKAVVMPIRLGP